MKYKWSLWDVSIESEFENPLHLTLSPTRPSAIRVIRHFTVVCVRWNDKRFRIVVRKVVWLLSGVYSLAASHFIMEFWHKIFKTKVLNQCVVFNLVLFITSLKCPYICSSMYRFVILWEIRFFVLNYLFFFHKPKRMEARLERVCIRGLIFIIVRSAVVHNS